MIIHYHEPSLTVTTVIYQFDSSYRSYLETQSNWIEYAEDRAIDTISLFRTASGDIQVRILDRMSISAPARFTVNVESSIGGIPKSSKVYAEGNLAGVMDKSETLKFTPQTAGAYTFEFVHPDYVKQELKIEALPE